MLLLAPRICFFVLVAGVVAVGLVSWRRTASIRRGTTPRASDGPVATAFRSSKTTLLAALAGAAAAAWGATAAVRGGTEALPMIAGGTFVAVAGSVARVSGIRVSDAAVVIRFAARPPFRASWSEICGLRPPGTPVGGWRLTVTGGRRATLMPSDLFGHEEVLTLIVHRAGLRFEGQMWIKGSSREPDPGDGAGLSRRRW